ncbi:MAG TPA: cytochrome c oxidase subunit I, partial [Planctomycetaceae bacterium]|nr:cytochrome c oxidase subunit I [Planctomycetaceae bacterium]
MATAITDAIGPDAHSPSAGENYLTCDRSIRSWVLTLDHKRVGVMFLVTVVVCLGLGALFALLIRTELTTPGPTIM